MSKLAAVLTLAALAGCGGCVVDAQSPQLAEPEVTEVYDFPETCKSSALQHYYISNLETRWQRAFEEAASRWYVRSGGCIVLTFEPITTRDVERAICKHHTVVVGYDGGKTSDGLIRLGYAISCPETYKVAISVFNKHMGTDFGYWTNVAEHELGHGLGFDHVLTENCIMSSASGVGATWCAADQNQCVVKGYCP